MKLFISTFLLVMLVFNNPFSGVQAQDLECCGDEDEMLFWEEWNYWQNKKDSLLGVLKLLDEDISRLRSQLSDKDRELEDAERQLYASVGSDKAGVDAFRSKFSEAEKLINACKDAESAKNIRVNYFNEIEASRIKCLPEFWDRYLAMKRKLEECETKVETVGQYTVLKGDYLIKIAQKVYGNGNCWPVIWEANRDGVISAPPGIPRTIRNPNLIYPGQVLRIPEITGDCSGLRPVFPRRTWRQRNIK